MACSVAGSLSRRSCWAPVDVTLLDPVIPADDQVEPDKQLKVGAEPVLHRQPHVPVDILAPAGQPHEQVVAEQVGLAQLQPGVVQGLEDPVHVVAALGGDFDDRQPRPDRLLDAGDVLVVIGVIHAGEHGAEELVGLRHRTRGGRAGSTEDDRPVRVPVSLRGKQPQMVIALTELVDKVLAVDPVSVAAAVIADGGQGQHQGRQALLAIHQQPPGNPRGLQGRARRDDHRAHKVRTRGRPVRHRLTLCEQIPPQLRQLLAAPAVGPLIERNLELFLALDKIEKAHLMCTHASPTPD
jgi:hypothetical protein